MLAQDSEITPPPLTALSADEQLFQSTVRKFAREQIRPYVREMDEAGVFRKDIIKQFFEMGLMGIEIPEEYGGQGGTFFQAILAVEELSAVDPSAGVIVDVQNTICNNALLRWATPEQKAKYLPRLAADTVASYALSEAGSGSDAFAMATRAEDHGDHFLLNGRKLWITNAAEAGFFLLFANANPEAGYKRHHRVPDRARIPRLPGRQEGGQARPARLLHLRTDPGQLPRARAKTCSARSARATRSPSRR